jgi:tRNA dimethylallyltransferase
MQSQNKTKPLIVLIGPTAVGKTEISLQLAERLKGEIVSADSRLLYRGMDIGTAKPTIEERTRVTHHLIDIADPNEVWSLAKYQRVAYLAIDDIHNRGKIPFLVGGTGQYIRAVIEGWVIPKVKPDPRLRLALQNWAIELGPFELHKRLAVLDPEASEKVEPQNLRRIIRALEVIFHTGRLFSAQRKKIGTPYRPIILGIIRPRPELYARIDARIQTMLDSGLVEEVTGLLDSGFPPRLPAFSAIGYHQIIQYVQGDIQLDEAVMLMKKLTRQYVRRQANWFSLDSPDIHWFPAGPNIPDEMEAVIEDFLNL